MSISDEQGNLDYLREEADGAEATLYFAVVDSCSGDHKTAQYRDGKPPWCRHCGRTDRGKRIEFVS